MAVEFSQLIEIIKRNDVDTLSKIDQRIIKEQFVENKDTLLHYACLFGAHKCTLYLLDKIDPFAKNINNHTPIDLLQLKYLQFKDDPNYNEVIKKVKSLIDTSEKRNIICYKVSVCLKFNLYEEIAFLFKLIDISKDPYVYYKPQKENKLSCHNFIYLAYQYNDKKFYKMLKEQNVTLNSEEMIELKKIAIFEKKYDWYSLITNETYYDLDSEEVSNAVSQLI